MSPARSMALATMAAILCALALAGALAISQTTRLVDMGLHQNGVPHVTNNDGYYHLVQARELAASGKGLGDVFSDGRQSMLLPYLLSVVADDPTALHKAGAWLGPLLGLSMLLAVLPWAMDSGSRFTAIAGSLLALLAPYWLVRTQVGFLDTDGLTPGLCFFALFCLYRFTTGESSRIAWGAGYVLTMALLWFWWRPGAFLSASFLLCYLIHPAGNGMDRRLKPILVVAILAAAGLAVAGVQPLAGTLQYAVAHLTLAFGSSGGNLLSQAIIELKGVGLISLGNKSLGTAWLLPLALVGTAAYCVRRRWKALFLASAWLLGMAGLLSQRFIPLFVPVGAFFTAYGAAFCCEAITRRVTDRATVRVALFTAALPLLLWGAGAQAVAFEPRPYFTKSDFAMAKTVRASFPQDTVIWTWWDFGYFFRYQTGMETYFDGGSQTERTCFIAAYPLMQEDLAVASAWMHHFAWPGSKFSTDRLGPQWPESLEEFTRNNPDDSGGAPVALVLPARVYSTTGYLYSFAHAFDHTVPPVRNHLDLFPKKDFHYKPGQQSVVIPEAMLDKGYTSFGGVVDATDADPLSMGLETIPDPYLVFSRKTDFLAVTDRPLIKSILFRLLGLFPYHTHFEPVAFDYRTGGIWRVR